MISGISGTNQYYAMQQAYQAQATASAASTSAADLFADEADTGDESSSTGAMQSSAASSSASGPSPDLLSSSTLASLLGLQMVNGQADGGATAAQLNLSQMSQPLSVDPNAMLNPQTLQILQSIS